MTLSLWAAITVVFVVLADIAVIVVRKCIKQGTLRQYHEVTDPLLSMVGMLFAILLGFMVASSMTRYDAARSNLQQEAGAVGDMFRIARALPEPARDKILKDCLTYTEIVIDEEWKAMKDAQTSVAAWNAYGDIWHDASQFEPHDQKESNLHQCMLEVLTRLGDGRRTRAAQLSYSQPPSLWVVVIVGVLAIICFTLFFDIDSVAFQVAMESIVVTVLSLNIYLLVSYDRPFTGDVELTSAPFEVNRIMFKSIMAKGWH
jgi:hypothetical protein